MGLIIKEIELLGSKACLKAKALFDTGAMYSFIRRDIAKKVEVITSLNEPMKFKVANSEYMKITQAIRIGFILNNVKLSDEFMVADDLSVQLIIGAATMQKWKIKIDYDKEEITVNPNVVQLMLI